MLDTQSRQSAQRSHERYLRLIAFIIHQYLTVGYALILTFRQAVTGTLNDSEQSLKDQFYQGRQATAGLVGQVVRRADVYVDVLGQIETNVSEMAIGDEQKIVRIRQLLDRKRLSSEQLAADQQRLMELKTVNQPVADRDDYYNTLEKESLRLQARTAGIAQVLVFDESPPARDGRIVDPLAAIRHFQAHREN